jgi:hypothetical protein
MLSSLRMKKAAAGSFGPRHSEPKLKQLALMIIPLLLLDCSESRKEAARPGDYAARIGVAVQSHDRVCLSINNPHLQIKDPVTLIAPSDPQSIARAEIVNLGDCGGGKNGAPPGYLLRLVSGTVPDHLPLIALTGDPALRTGNGNVIADLNGNGKSDSFRSCASSEGVHLTVWEGRPLEGIRIWHQYHYLGQDLEANCEKKDTAE